MTSTNRIIGSTTVALQPHCPGNIFCYINFFLLTKEEKKLVIPMMANYLEKCKPDNTFDKFKV
jgi:hypothetical protein